MPGFIKLHRKITDSTIFRNPVLLKIWIWCLCEAKYSPQIELVGLKEVLVDRGGFLTGRKKASAFLGLEESTFWRHLKVLESMRMITIDSNNKCSLINVINYTKYQDQDFEPEQPMDNQWTTSGQRMDTNKEKKDKKEKKDPSSSAKPPSKIFLDDSDEMKLALVLAGKMRQNNPDCRLPTSYQEWCKHFDLMIRRDKRTPKQIQDVIVFCQRDPFWSSNILSAKTLREKFDTLTMKMKASLGGEKTAPEPGGEWNFFND